MTNTKSLCPFCGEPVDPDSPEVARQVHWWEHPATGEMVDVTPTGVIAHGKCVDADAAAAELEAPPKGPTQP